MTDMERLAKQDKAINNLRTVLAVDGRCPEYHQAQINRLRREWPMLWRAIQEVIREEYKKAR